ncbi:MAG: aldehyde dehydrogenase family protein [Bdellovibrionaceae bacterium]|nr:aldehyde dehydrogenase family protein [Pseudobdellovibrionaceae bacterium]
MFIEIFIDMKRTLFGLAIVILFETALAAPSDFCKQFYLGKPAKLGVQKSSEKSYQQLLRISRERDLNLLDGADIEPRKVLAFLTTQRHRSGIATEKIPKGLDEDLLDLRNYYNKQFGKFFVLTNQIGQIVGTAGLVRVGANEAELRKIYIDSSISGMGIAKALTQTLLDFANDFGYSSVRLETYSHLKDAINLYGTLGFEKAPDKIKEEPDVIIFRKKIKQESTAVRLRSVEAKREYFRGLHKTFVDNREKIRAILIKVETELGADYEIRQAEDTLVNAGILELQNLQRTQRLENVAVYGSTNIPLYTLIMHGFIPLTVSDAVWFRTPKATREIYLEIFNLLTLNSPPGTFQGLNILSEARDVQYDNFRRLHVMGLNLKGTKEVRPASEVVIFTGSPETGRQILKENIEKLSANSGFKKQMFLMFGSGMNPLVVTKDAKSNLESAVNAAMDSVMINSGQDCIAPNFVLVDESVSREFITELRKKMSKVKVAISGPTDTTIKPLSFSDSLDGLVQYRTQFSKNLVNPETAAIDIATNAVSPHLFAFSGKDFSRVPLREHFAPFLVVFTYKNHQELQSMIQDRRVQNKVMYASVFGAPHATQEVSSVTKILQENRHGVSVNASIYSDESGNMPFGGLGPDSSTVTVISKKGATVEVQRAQKPLLFSEEAAREFTTLIEFVPSKTVERIAKDTFNYVFRHLDNSPKSLPKMLYGWENLKFPQQTNTETGLIPLRSAIASSNLYRVINGNQPPSSNEVSRLEYFYGSELVFAGDHISGRGNSISHIPGVALHVTMPEEGPNLLNSVRGDVNPHLGRGLLTGILDGNKRIEYFVAEAIKPGVMPATETFGSLKNEGVLTPDFEKMRNEIKSKVEEMLKAGQPLKAEQYTDLKQNVVALVQNIFSSIRNRFPKGAYFKNFDDFATADLGIQITSFSSNPMHIAQQFVMRLNEVLVNGKSKKDLFESFNFNPYETGAKFVLYTLEKPDSIIAQVRENIAKTSQGHNLEFRVDFISGETFHTKLRFSREYYPKESADAATFLNDFFRAAPPELRHMSGGADIAKTVDGRWIIIEFNFGSSSGTLMPKYFILDNHESISAIQGHDTRLLSDLKHSLALGKTEIIKYFKSLKLDREPWNKKSIDDLSAVEYGRWLRDQFLKKWQTDPTRESANKTLDEIKEILTSRGPPGEDLQRIIEGAEQFFERSLGPK